MRECNFDFVKACCIRWCRNVVLEIPVSCLASRCHCPLIVGHLSRAIPNNWTVWKVYCLELFARRQTVLINVLPAILLSFIHSDLLSQHVNKCHHANERPPSSATNALWLHSFSFAISTCSFSLVCVHLDSFTLVLTCTGLDLNHTCLFSLDAPAGWHYSADIRGTSTPEECISSRSYFSLYSCRTSSDA